MDEELQNKLIEWVRNNYDPTECGYTPDKSFGDDWGVFYDGFYCGYSTAAYDVDRILGMELEPPEEPK